MLHELRVGKKTTIFHNKICTDCAGTGYHTIWVPSGGEGPPIGVVLKDEYVNANAICPYCKGRGQIEYSEEIQEVS